jgi:hypothetical protein
MRQLNLRSIGNLFGPQQVTDQPVLRLVIEHGYERLIGIPGPGVFTRTVQ